jgi:GH25 family lysozyme M1 (1,4-beta-N-acetylmuramidase)
MEVLFGPDVSHHQGPVDWQQIGSHCAYAFCKATEGSTFRDSQMKVNRRGMNDARLVLRGLYHFARPGRNSAAAEADNFCDTVGSLEPGEVAVLDLESTEINGPATGRWAREWMSIVERRLGTTPWLYSFSPFLQGMDTSGLQQYPLWIAKYGKNDGKVPATRPNVDRWANFTVWQFTDKGRQPGVSGNCDLNLFEGTKQDLARLTGTGIGEDEMAATIICREPDENTGLWLYAGGAKRHLDRPEEIHELRSVGLLDHREVKLSAPTFDSIPVMAGDK